MTRATSTERKIDYMPLGRLKGATRNPKSHNMPALASSMDRFGYVEPVVIDERTKRLVAGHGRMAQLRALKAEGAPPPDGVVVADNGDWSVPVLRGWRSKDDREAEGYLLAANRITELGGWNDEELAEVLGGLEESLQAATGFDQGYLDDLMAKLQEATSDFAFDPESRYGEAGRTGAEPGLDGRQTKYQGKDVRSVVLDYAIAEYEEFVVMAAKGRARHEVDSTAELLFKLLRADHPE